jgi:hypothetical protein
MYDHIQKDHEQHFFIAIDVLMIRERRPLVLATTYANGR